jgi:rRNA maturation protein Nop10
MAELSCPYCHQPVENVYPARFSMEDKYQKYRLGYFKEKMKGKFPDLK